MGAGGSKTGGSKAQNIGEIDNSSGFHLLEIHVPSMGIGIGSIVLTVFLVAIVMIIMQKCHKCRNWHSSTPQPPVPQPQSLVLQPPALPLQLQPPCPPYLQPAYPQWHSIQMAAPMPMATPMPMAMPLPLHTIAEMWRHIIPAIKAAPRLTIQQEQQEPKAPHKYTWEAWSWKTIQ